MFLGSWHAPKGPWPVGVGSWGCFGVFGTVKYGLLRLSRGVQMRDGLSAASTPGCLSESARVQWVTCLLSA
jgi:hypothetical protein